MSECNSIECADLKKKKIKRESTGGIDITICLKKRNKD